MVREKNIEKVENVKGSEDLNKKHSGQVLRSKSSATAFVATILPCEVGASKGERANMDLQEVRTNGLLVVCFTAIILIGCLAMRFKYLCKPGLKVAPYRRLLGFEKYAMVAGATWLGTAICFAVEETLLFSHNLQWFTRGILLQQ